MLHKNLGQLYHVQCNKFSLVCSVIHIFLNNWRLCYLSFTHCIFFLANILIFNYQNHTTTSFCHNKLHWMGLLHGFKNATAFYNSSYLDLDTWCWLAHLVMWTVPTSSVHHHLNFFLFTYHGMSCSLLVCRISFLGVLLWQYHWLGMSVCEKCLM